MASSMSDKTCQVYKVAVSWVWLLPSVFQKGPLTLKIYLIFFCFVFKLKDVKALSYWQNWNQHSKVEAAGSMAEIMPTKSYRAHIPRRLLGSTELTDSEKLSPSLQQSSRTFSETNECFSYLLAALKAIHKPACSSASENVPWRSATSSHQQNKKILYVKTKHLLLSTTSQAFDILVLFPSLRTVVNLSPFIFTYFPCPQGTFNRKKQLKDMSEMPRQKYGWWGDFHMDLRELRNTAAASTEFHQTQGFITLLKHFLSVLSFKCLKDLPACACFLEWKMWQQQILQRRSHLGSGSTEHDLVKSSCL